MSDVVLYENCEVHLDDDDELAKISDVEESVLQRVRLMNKDIR